MIDTPDMKTNRDYTDMTLAVSHHINHVTSMEAVSKCRWERSVDDGNDGDSATLSLTVAMMDLG